MVSYSPIFSSSVPLSIFLFPSRSTLSASATIPFIFSPIGNDLSTPLHSLVPSPLHLLIIYRTFPNQPRQLVNNPLPKKPPTRQEVQFRQRRQLQWREHGAVSTGALECVTVLKSDLPHCVCD